MTRYSLLCCTLMVMVGFSGQARSDWGNFIELSVGHYIWSEDGHTLTWVQPEYINLGEVVHFGYFIWFDKYDYREHPVDIYVALIKNPVCYGPSSLQDALNGEVVYYLDRDMNLSLENNGPTYRYVIFTRDTAGQSGWRDVRVPEGENVEGNYAFATAFIYCRTGKFVRNDGFPVEVSNYFVVQNMTPTPTVSPTATPTATPSP